MNALLSPISRVVRSLFLSGSGVALTAGMLLPGVVLHAQSSKPALVTESVNEAHRVVLKGNTHPLATKAADRGAVPDSMQESDLLLVLQRSPERESALRASIESLHDSTSPNFHKWLTPAQFAAQWGAADSDIAAATAWLQSHGMTVTGPNEGHTAIQFSGTAGQIGEAFHTSIHTFVVNGETHHANVSDPQIPAALAPLVAGVSTLNDFHLKSMAKAGPRGIYDTKTHQVRPDAASLSKLRPNQSIASGGEFLYVGPADAATIYDTPNGALNANYLGNGTFDGTGVKIGIVGDSFIDITQNANYRTLFDLAPLAPIVKLANGTDPGTNGDAIEGYIDTQIASAIAPGANVYFYYAGGDNGIQDAVKFAIDKNAVDVLSISFGECEGQLGASGNAMFETFWEQATAQGISVVAATGDSGSANCDDPNAVTEASYGLQVNGVASTAYDIAVGGTDFYALLGPDGNGANYPNYVLPVNANRLRTANTYIPESPWNDTYDADTYPPASYSANKVSTLGYDQLSAAGGGRSNCTVGTINADSSLDCKSGYVKPAWQVASGVPADNARDIPDLSLFAGNGHALATWAVCTDQDTDANGNPVTDCVPFGADSDEVYVSGYGGTSASAPAFAGVLALVKQATGQRQGQADYVLYNLARNASLAPSVFHDVTVGNNSVPCATNSPDCANDSAGYYFLKGYNTTAGYDLASGLGSVDVANMITSWSSVALGSTTTQLMASPTSIQHGQTVTANVNVTNEGDTATGKVTLSASTTPQALTLGSFPLMLGGVTGNITLADLPGGSYNLSATYQGIASLSQSVSNTVAITVAPEPSTTTVTVKELNPTSGGVDGAASTPYGYFADLTAAPVGNSKVGVPTGTVVFTVDDKTLGGPVSLGTTGTATVNHTILPVGEYAVRAAYSGDASFQASSGQAVVDVVKATTKLQLTSSATSYNGQAITFTVNLSTNSAGAAPTGEVELQDGSTVLGEVHLEGVAASGTTLASGSATFSVSNFAVNQVNSIRAVYVGDANYSGSTSNAIKVTDLVAIFTLNDLNLTLSSEHSTQVGNIVATSVGGYAGTVNLACKLTSNTTMSTSTPAECAMDPGTATVAAHGTGGSLILIFGNGTKLPTGITASGVAGRWLGAGSAILAFALFFGIPARRRGWKNMLTAVLLLVSMSGFTACVSQPKFVSAGTYVFQVTGVDSKNPALTATSTVTVNVPQ
ncbi:Ig-like domain repeat protein [Acidicapsa ligni]|uniref:Ig-like domain repeat protein n=1 Tax=Acidicapsa ligni TaxID=542300 RepID=UPI0021DF7039|nr:Ig-like domain repeat protein [Acidicapsa ligni]